MLLPLSTFLWGFLAMANAEAALRPRGPTCSDIRIPVSINAQGMTIDPTIDSTDKLRSAMNVVAGLVSLIFNVRINGQYTLAARYCEPEVQNATRADTIQLLQHGITYTKDYWSGLGPPGAGYDGDTYSWIAYASLQGYPTLSIDRLGNGDSDRPNGIAVVQLPAHVEVTHSLIQTLKTGTSIGGRSFSKVVYVGHWYGSLIGNIHAVTYPTEVDAYVLTGYTKKVKPSLIPTLIAGGFVPAALALPDRFGNLGIGYFAATNQAGANGLFFVNETVDPGLAQVNWDLRGTVTVGEFISAYGSEQVASNYRGQVFLLTGDKDAIFCSPDPFGGGTLSGHGDCGVGDASLPATTRDLYPAASVYGYNMPVNIGHCNILHRGARDQFTTAHDWLASVGY